MAENINKKIANLCTLKGKIKYRKPDGLVLNLNTPVLKHVYSINNDISDSHINKY